MWKKADIGRNDIVESLVYGTMLLDTLSRRFNEEEGLVLHVTIPEHA